MTGSKRKKPLARHRELAERIKGDADAIAQALANEWSDGIATGKDQAAEQLPNVHQLAGQSGGPVDEGLVLSVFTRLISDARWSFSNTLGNTLLLVLESRAGGRFDMEQLMNDFTAAKDQVVALQERLRQESARRPDPGRSRRG